MEDYKQGDIVLANFPFSDKTNERKIRPALIISKDKANLIDNDLVLLQITSQKYIDEFVFDLTPQSLTIPLALSGSIVRCNKITTLRTNLVYKVISSLTSDALYQIKKLTVNLVQ